jgi:hypothetical protein
MLLIFLYFSGTAFQPAGRLGSQRLRASETPFETQKYEQHPALFLIISFCRKEMRSV